MVLAFKHESIIVIEDIGEENLKTVESKRWEDLRTNQSQDYESMICVPIVSGVRGQPGRKCLGILVVDTNRERYFLEEKDFQAFLGDILNPFRHDSHTGDRSSKLPLLKAPTDVGLASVSHILAPL